MLRFMKLQEDNSKQYLITTREGKKYLAYLQDTEKSKLTAAGAKVEDPATGQDNSSSIVSEEVEEDVQQVKEGDIIVLAKEIGKSLTAALKEHGDDVAAISIKNCTDKGCIVKVRYKQDENTGVENVDEFEFVYTQDNPSGVVLKVGDKDYKVCTLEQNSGTVYIKKDVAKAALLSFLKEKTDIPIQNLDEQVESATPRETMKYFSEHYSDQDLADTWERIYPQIYRQLEETVLYKAANAVMQILICKGIVDPVTGNVVNRPWEKNVESEDGE